MLKPQDIIFIPDFARLPKSILGDIANEMDIPNNAIIELATSIYEKCEENNHFWDIAYTLAKPYIFAGKCSVSWYRVVKNNDETSLLKIISDKIGFNPLETKNPNLAENIEQKISSTPQIIGGMKLNGKGTSYLLRFIFKSEVRRKLSGLTPSNESITLIVTALINEDEDVIEIRGNDKTIKKVEQFIGGILAGEIEPIERRCIIAPFGNQIEQFADSLGGKLVETVSIPEEVLDELSEEQATAIGDILIAIDDYFLSGDIAKVEEALRDSRACFANEEGDCLSIPFTAVVLAGMNRLGMTANDELRSQPLYNVLQPYLQHQGGFIKFPVDDDGVRNYYTIKVGLKTNTIYFVTPATEKVIQFVRNKVMDL